MSRDVAYEREFVTRAERQAGLMGLGFADQVIGRLQLMALRHGNRWCGMTVRKLLSEIREEGLDVAGWGVLAAQRALELERRGRETMELRMKLQEIASKGAEIENLVRQAAQLLE